MSEDYLTIAEFAKAVNMSKQGIYQRLKKDLAPFLREINGTKCLSIDALDLFSNLSTAEQESEIARSDAFNALIEQLVKKDKLIEQQQSMIEQQTAQIGKLQDHISQQSTEMVEMLKKQNQLQENFQVLLKQQQDVSMLETSSNNLKADGNQVVQPAEETQATPQPEKKPGFFSRLFGW